MSQRIRVNPIMCVGHGMCAELLPEFITMDRWGYPIVPTEAVPEELELLAKRAAADCPTLALLVEEKRHE